MDFQDIGYELFTLPVIKKTFTISSFISNNLVLSQIKGKKWHWRARTSALYFAEMIPRKHAFE